MKFSQDGGGRGAAGKGVEDGRSLKVQPTFECGLHLLLILLLLLFLLFVIFSK